MKKINSILFFLILTLFLQGCIDANLDIGESIVPPKNKVVPIKGTWKVEYNKLFSTHQSENEKLRDLVKRPIIFDQEVAIFGDEICIEPQYKIKNVNAKDYFFHTHKVNDKDLDSRNKRVDIISITSKEKHFYDFIRVNENKLMVYIDGKFYNLIKISNRVVDKNFKYEIENKNVLENENIYEPELLRSGVLIGLGDDKNRQNYRTLWIATKNRKLYSIKEMKNLLLPRKSGFWIVGKDRSMENEYGRDELFAYPIKDDGTYKQEKKKVSKEIEKDHSIKRIQFIGNDYVSIEYGNDFDKVQFLPIDNIEKNIGVKISDIEGENGKDIFMNSALGYIENLSKDQFNEINKPEEEDFLLQRKNGHWIMKGRLYYKYKDGFLEFNINMIPPYKIVHYDTLHVSWNEIKQKIPNAVDAFTSPNEDLAIISTKDALYVYTLKNKKLSNSYIGKIDLKEERIVMAEWATGNYVEKWDAVLENKNKE